jgi:hypothetical protein
VRPSHARSAHPFAGVDAAQDVLDFRPHHHSRKLGIDADEFMPMRCRVLRAQMVGDLVQNDEFTHSPSTSIPIIGDSDGPLIPFAFVVGGGGASARAHPKGPSGPAVPDEPQHVVDVTLNGVDRREPGLWRQGQIGAEEVDISPAVVRGPLEEGSDELFGGVDLGASRVTGSILVAQRCSNAPRAPANSESPPLSLALRPARSPARRACDE